MFSSADPDSQLYDMGYTPEEEAPACPDEFDDFVTFEASMSPVNACKYQLYGARLEHRGFGWRRRVFAVTGLRDA